MTEKKTAITLKADARELLALIEVVEGFLEVGDRLIDIPDCPQEIVSVYCDASATATGELVVRLQPTDAFRRFVSALALDRDLLVV